MSIAQDLMERKERPPYVKFVRTAIDDPAATKSAGHYVAKDVDFAHITPAYSKDIFKQPVDEWFSQLENDVRNERIPQQWLEQFKESYRAFQNGQEMPLHGTPIKGWGVISPAQQETLIRMNCLTVEDLSKMNDEGIKRFGMGAAELKMKATAWLDELKEKGSSVVRVGQLEQENALLRKNLEDLTKVVEDLKSAIEIKGTAPVSASISVSDVLETREDLVAQYTAKFGKPPHHRKSDATIRAELG